MVNHKTSENENEDEKMRTITRAKEMDECADWPRKGEREGTVTGEEIGPTERREEHEALITSRDISIIFLVAALESGNKVSDCLRLDDCQQSIGCPPLD